MSKGSRLPALVFIFFLYSVLPLIAQQRYTLTDIGNLGGYYGGYATAINSRGEVVGLSDVTHDIEEDTDHAFYWSQSTGMIDLGTFYKNSAASGINRSGTVVGGTDSDGNPFETLGFQWTKTGGMRSLHGISVYVDNASDINDAGQEVGTGWVVRGEVLHAYHLTGFVLEDLGTLGGKNSYAEAINATGQVVGFSNTPTSGVLDGHAFRWEEGSGMKDLGTLPGDSFSGANAINKSGVIVGGSYSVWGHYHGVLWTETGGIRRIATKPDFPASNTSYNALGVNDIGQVVGYAGPPFGPYHAMIWTKAAGMHDLNKLIPANTGWVLVDAYDINNAGQIVGRGHLNDSPDEDRAFLLTPVK